MMAAFIQAAQSLQSVQSIAFGSANTAGNVLVAICGNETASNFAISDTQNNSWTALPQQNNGNHSSRAFYVLNCNGGANTVSFTVSSSSVPQIAVAEYSGIPALDSSAQAVVAQGSSAGASVTTSNPSTIVIGLFDDNDATYGAGNGWNLRTSNSPSNIRTLIVDAAFSVTGTYSPGFSKSPTTGATETNTLAFIAAVTTPFVPLPELHITYSQVTTQPAGVQKTGGNYAVYGNNTPSATINNPDDSLGTNAPTVANQNSVLIVSPGTVNGRFNVFNVLNNPA